MKRKKAERDEERSSDHGIQRDRQRGGLGHLLVTDHHHRAVLNRFEGMDIRCVRLLPYEVEGEGSSDIQQVLPLPEAADYQVRLRHKDAARDRARTQAAISRGTTSRSRAPSSRIKTSGTPSG